MAINKVIYDGNTLIDISDSTVTPETLEYGTIAYNAKGEKIVGVALNGYTPLEYIQTTGTQCINTGCSIDNNTRIVCDFQFDNSTPDTSTLFGAIESGNNAILFVYNNYYCNYYYGSGSLSWYTSMYKENRYVLDCNKNVVTLGNESQTLTTNAFSTGNYSLYLFSYNYAGNPIWYANVRLYSCQIYQNDIIIRNYVPCIGMNGEVGLYDTVNKKFYGNVGTGQFLYG